MIALYNFPPPLLPLLRHSFALGPHGQSHEWKVQDEASDVVCDMRCDGSACW